MTKVTGIDIGRAWIHLVEVDGSPRKYTVSKVHSVARDPNSPNPGADLARAFEECGAVRNRALLAVPGNLCTFRNMNLPFKGVDAIKKVLKFEAESVIHSHAIDDIIVEGTPIVENPDGTEIFMAACPKDYLREGLAALKQAAVEVEVFDLDVTLLVNAAKNLGHFQADEGEKEDGFVIEGDSQVIIGLGSESTTFILVKDGKLLTARVLRWGVDHLIRSLARSLAIDPLLARASLDHFLGLEVPAEVAVAIESELTEEESEEIVNEAAAEVAEAVEAGPAIVQLDPLMLQKEIRSLAQSIFRELTRFLAGTKGVGNPTKLLITGGGGLLPDFMDILEEESGVGVQALDLLGCSQDVAPAVGELEPQLDLALAAAMAGIGAIETSMNFRSEDLVFKRKFEQLKFPLATLVLAGAIALFFLNILDVKALNDIEGSMGVWIEEPRARGSDKKLPSGYAKGLLQPYVYSTRSRTKYHANSTVGRVLSGNKQCRELYNKLQAAGRFDRIAALRTFLRNEKTAEGKATGYFPEIKLESGTAVLQCFMEAVMAADKDPELKRFIIPEMDLLLGREKKNRRFTFTVAFMGAEEFRQQNAIFDKHMKAVLGNGTSGNGSPFESVEFKFSKILEEGIYRGSYIYEFTIKPSFDVFQPLNPGK